MSDTPSKSRLFGLFRRPSGPAAPEPSLPEPAAPKTAHEAQPEASSPPADQTLAQTVAETMVHATTQTVAPDAAEPPRKAGWFQRLKAGLTKTSAKLSQDVVGIFTKRKLDADTLQELEDSLIEADLGVETAMRITESLAKGRYNKEIAPAEVRAVLAAEVERVLVPVARPLVLDGQHRPHVILVVGVNGTGKTTTIGKLAQRFVGEGKKVTLAAGDTFRAAAIEQLKIWGERTGAEVVARATGADAAGLAYDALARARENSSEVLLIDTAGRLQNKQVLMGELEKVIRVLRKIDATAPHHVLLVLDASTGQNALNQVEVFREKAGVTGLVMTKLDGTAKGGILVAISAKFGLPVHAIGVGEGVEDLAAFDAGEFARAVALS
ncbi:MAG: signal recognition particle-docking protein FtsY [Hyphomicrobiaceae bacterium]|nr:signal recognition particle-docking protein FtsY [Hyphomicrobiaceae bacterium]